MQTLLKFGFSLELWPLQQFIIFISNLFKCSHNTYKILWNVSHCGLAIQIKNVSKAKEEFWKLQYNFTLQKYNLKKIL
jgi:hypothetical protein